MTVDSTGNAGLTVNIPRLQYIPRGWAPYFIGGMSPESAMRLIRQLITGLTESQREIAMPLERWCAAACSRIGSIVGAQRAKSTVYMAWASPASSMDRALGRWARVGN